MELAKKFLFKLDSKSVKVLKEKSFVCYDTDTIKLVIEILENDDYKDLYNSNIEVIFSYPNGESVPIKKQVGDKLLAGSFITAGNCIVRADAVGKNNYVEKLSAEAKKYKKPYSELMNSLKTIIKIIDTIMSNILLMHFLYIFFPP